MDNNHKADIVYIELCDTCGKLCQDGSNPGDKFYHDVDECNAVVMASVHDS